MAEHEGELFTKLRGVIGRYLVDLILEEGEGGVARLVREGLEARANLTPDEEAYVTKVLHRLEGGR